MLPLWPFLSAGRVGDFSCGFILEGLSRAPGLYERTGGRWPFWDFPCEREERRLLLNPANQDHRLAEIRLGMTGAWASGTNISRLRRPCSRT